MVLVRFLLFVVFALIHFLTLAQGEDNIWYIGTLNGGTTQGGAIDFNLATPAVVGGAYVAPNMVQTEGTASRCDAGGALLFYTDGVDIWDENHAIMPNGAGLGGHRSSRFPALIVPDPASADRYYVFANDGHTTGNGTGLHYSLIDMTLSGGNGDVVAGVKALPLLSNTSEDLTGALHCNGTDYWVMVLDYPTVTGNPDLHVYAYQVSAAGIGAPVVSNLGTFGGLSLTDMFEMSPDGSKGVVRLQGAGGWTDAVLDFDNITGVFTVNTTLNTGGRGGYSPDSQIYYVGNGANNLVQYNANNMTAAPTVVANGVGQFDDFRIGPNGKLYMSRWAGIHAIDNPNTLGVGCNFVANSIPNPGMMGGPSMLPNVFLKSTGVSCLADTVFICEGDSIFTDGNWVSTSGLYGDTLVEVVTVDMQPAGPFCPSDNAVMLSGTPSGGVWTGTGITNAMSGMFSPSVSGTGNHLITYSVAPNANLTCEDTFTIVVLAPDDSSFAYAQNGFCLQDSNPVANVTGLPGGTFSIDNGGAINSATGEIDLMSSGVGSFTVTYQTNGPCPTSSTVVIEISSPTVDLGPDVSSCNPSLTLDAGNAGSQYLWQDGSVDQTLSVTSVGTYSVQVTDANGCVATDTMEVLPGTMTVDLGEDTVVCSGANLVLDAGNAGAVYAWNDGSSAQTLAVNAPGTYWVEVQNGNCTDSDTIVVSYSTVTAAFSPTDTSGCAAFELTFSDLSSTDFGSITSWAWDFGDGGSASDQNPNYEYSSGGTYSVSLLVTNSHGCTGTATGQVEVYDQPQAAFTMDPSVIFVNEEIRFLDQSSNDVTSWSWDFGDNTVSSIQNPVHIYNSATDYEVELRVSNGFCVDTITKGFTVNEPLLYYIPNAFSPDGDEFNNVFLPVFTSGFDPFDYELTIFNRWGQSIFTSQDVALGWDGTYNGRMVQDGTYTWRIEFKELATDRRHHVVGHVTMLR